MKRVIEMLSPQKEKKKKKSRKWKSRPWLIDMLLIISRFQCFLIIEKSVARSTKRSNLFPISDEFFMTRMARKIKLNAWLRAVHVSLIFRHSPA